MNNKQAKRLRKIALSYHLTAEDTTTKQVYKNLKTLYKIGAIKTV